MDLFAKCDSRRLESDWLQGWGFVWLKRITPPLVNDGNDIEQQELRGYHQSGYCKANLFPARVFWVYGFKQVSCGFSRMSAAVTYGRFPSSSRFSLVLLVDKKTSKDIPQCWRLGVNQPLVDHHFWVKRIWNDLSPKCNLNVSTCNFMISGESSGKKIRLAKYCKSCNPLWELPSQASDWIFSGSINNEGNPTDQRDSSPQCNLMCDFALQQRRRNCHSSWTHDRCT